MITVGVTGVGVERRRGKDGRNATSLFPFSHVHSGNSTSLTMLCMPSEACKSIKVNVNSQVQRTIELSRSRGLAKNHAPPPYVALSCAADA